MEDAKRTHGQRRRIVVYSAAALLVAVSGALGNVVWRAGLLQPFVPTDAAFLVASGLIASAAITVWKPRDALLVWLVFLPITLALGVALVFMAAALYGDYL
jgi:hypothetical protein